MLVLSEGSELETDQPSLALQQPEPETGVRQPDKPERPVESYEADFADGAHENAKSSDKEKRAVADAVSDLDSSD